MLQSRHLSNLLQLPTPSSSQSPSPSKPFFHSEDPSALACFASLCLTTLSVQPPHPTMMAERILMNEFKILSKEPWTHIEASQRIVHCRSWFETNFISPAGQRQHPPVESGPHRPEQRLALLWRILSGEHVVPIELPVQPSG